MTIKRFATTKDKLEAELRRSDSPSVAYGYSRVSHLDGYAKNESVPAQHHRIEEYYDRVLGDECESLVLCNDPTHVSAYKVRFVNRPAGKSILSRIKAGDHLIVDKLDRLWRSVEDLIHLKNQLDAMGVTIHIVNMLGDSLKSNTIQGDMHFKMFGLMAELESRMKSERIKEALHIRRLRGHRFSGAVPQGCKVQLTEMPGKSEPVSALVWDRKQRQLMRFIVKLRDVDRLSWNRAFPLIEQKAAAIEKRPVRTLAQQHSDRTRVWRRMYQYETAFSYLGIREPSQIPSLDAIKAAAKQHRRRITDAKKRADNKASLSSIPKITPERILEIARSK